MHSEKDEGLGTLKAGFVRIERRKSYSCDEDAVIRCYSSFTTFGIYSRFAKVRMRELAGSVWLLVKRVMTGAVVGVTISDRFE